MRDDKPADSDILMFALVAIFAAMVAGALLWIAPSPTERLSLRNSLFIVPALSVMAAARGVSWRRRLTSLGATLAGFLIADYAAALFGMHAGQPEAPSGSADFIFMLIYRTFVITYPLVALVWFVGSRPSVLWERVNRTPPRARRR